MLNQLGQSRAGFAPEDSCVLFFSSTIFWHPHSLRDCWIFSSYSIYTQADFPDPFPQVCLVLLFFSFIFSPFSSPILQSLSSFHFSISLFLRFLFFPNSHLLTSYTFFYPHSFTPFQPSFHAHYYSVPFLTSALSHTRFQSSLLDSRSGIRSAILSRIQSPSISIYTARWDGDVMESIGGKDKASRARNSGYTRWKGNALPQWTTHSLISETFSTPPTAVHPRPCSMIVCYYYCSTWLRI